MTGLFLNCSTKSFKCGMALMQGPHHVAQNSNTTTFPFNLSQLISFAGEPCIVLVRVSGGGTSPILGPSLSAIANELFAKIPRKQKAAKMIPEIFMTF